jgi:hypothetical protein
MHINFELKFIPYITLIERVFQNKKIQIQLVSKQIFQNLILIFLLIEA